jgi:hypothetical protein
MDVFQLCSQEITDTAKKSKVIPEAESASNQRWLQPNSEMLACYETYINPSSKCPINRFSNEQTTPLLPPILPTEPPALFGGRLGSTPSAMSIPRRQLWTLPSRTPSYDSMNSETFDHESAKRLDIEKVKQLVFLL